MWPSSQSIDKEHRWPGAWAVPASVAVVLCIITGLGACTSGGREPAAKVDHESTQPSSSEYRAAWVERFRTEADPLPFQGIEACAADAAEAALGGGRLDAAGVTAADIAAGAAVGAQATEADVQAFGRMLRECDLAAGYATDMRTNMPGFMSDADAACVADRISRDEAYSAGLAAWIFIPETREWLEAVGPAFDRALVACPHAYGTITARALTRELGLIPAEGERCLVDGLAREVADLLSGDATRAQAALREVIAICGSLMGDIGDQLLRELE